MKVLIVGKTHMVGRYCIGGLTATNQAVRLLDSGGVHAPLSTPFNIGDRWDLAFTPALNLVPPHVEDVLLQGTGQPIGRQAQLEQYLRANAAPWIGRPQDLFGGAVQYTGNNRGFIDSANIPPMSTGFWIPDADLQHGVDHRNRVFYRYWHQNTLLDLPYVGVEAPVSVVPAGTLVRVSLARWWSPDPNFPSRCYVQLSGWF